MAFAQAVPAACETQQDSPTVQYPSIGTQSVTAAQAAAERVAPPLPPQEAAPGAALVGPASSEEMSVAYAWAAQ
eukprot:9136629-Lingulodinium_polyedra.AAC.1